MFKKVLENCFWGGGQLLMDFCFVREGLGRYSKGRG